MAGPTAGTGFLDTSGSGTWTPGPIRNAGHRDYGSAAIYDGKVLFSGGGDPPTKSVELIDLNAPAPTWIGVSPMQFVRRHHKFTLLPDGQVLVTGGTSSSGFNEAPAAVLEPEIWDPQAGTWSTIAPMLAKRLYHSTALLLPDGRVLTGGGGQPSSAGEVDQRNIEIFWPPYLFRGPRPVISGAPRVVTYGDKRFLVQANDVASIAKVTLIRLASVTHAFDQNQRLVNLTFAAVPGGLDVVVPNANVAPPGHYMLFIMNRAGVQSVASIVQVLGSATPPTISAIPDLPAADRDVPILVPFTVNDIESGPSALIVTAESSNQILVSNGNLVLSGSGFNRRLAITPAANQLWMTTITLTVGDGVLTTSTSFVLTVIGTCTFSIEPVSTTFGAAGGAGAVTVNAQSECPWTVTNLPTWAMSASGSAGAGAGSWQYTVTANGTGSLRSHVVSVAGQTFTLHQVGGSLKSLVPGTRTTFALANALDQYCSSIEAVAGRSYCAQVSPGAAAVNASTPSLTAFRSDGTTPLGQAGTRRTSFAAPATESVLQNDPERRQHAAAYVVGRRNHALGELVLHWRRLLIVHHSPQHDLIVYQTRQSPGTL
jgi:hypothetical protein